jgi:hypothetical protein
MPFTHSKKEEIIITSYEVYRKRGPVDLTCLQGHTVLGNREHGVWKQKRFVETRIE